MTKTTRALPAQAAQECIQPEILFSSDFWYNLVIQSVRQSRGEFDDAALHVYHALAAEKPSVVSAVMERSCNLQCQHCLYQQEASSEHFSHARQPDSLIANIVAQLPTERDGPRYVRPAFIHEGRVVRPWHIEVFEKVRRIRPDCQIGLIDNGTFTKYLDIFHEKNVRLDWLDVSLDGLEAAHNEQRDPLLKRAWTQAIAGLTQARRVTAPAHEGGRVTALMTLTSLNHADIKSLADFVFSPHPEAGNLPLADEFHITPMVPYLTENHQIDLSIDQFEQIWRQIREVWEQYNTGKQQRFFVKFYNVIDWMKLGAVIGFDRLWRALSDTESDGHVTVDIGSLTCLIDNVRISYFPTSLWPQESFLIDADGTNRVATSQQYRLDQLHTDPSLRKYTVGQLHQNDDFSMCYERELGHWWKYFGREYLQQEFATMQAIYQRL